MLTRILTFTEFRVWYKLSERTARRMLQSGEIVALKTPGGSWRIPDPGRHIVELTRQQAAELEAVPFIRGVEASQLLRISNRRLRQLAEGGKIEYRLNGKRRLYSLDSITSHIARRGRKRVQREGYVRPEIMNWAQRVLAEKLREQGVKTLPDFLQDGQSENPARPER